MMKKGGIKSNLLISEHFKDAIARKTQLKFGFLLAYSYLCTQKMKNVQVATCRNDIVVYPTAFLK